MFIESEEQIEKLKKLIKNDKLIEYLIAQAEWDDLTIRKEEHLDIWGLYFEIEIHIDPHTKKGKYNVEFNRYMHYHQQGTKQHDGITFSTQKTDKKTVIDKNKLKKNMNNLLKITKNFNEACKTYKKMIKEL